MWRSKVVVEGGVADTWTEGGHGGRLGDYCVPSSWGIMSGQFHLETSIAEADASPGALGSNLLLYCSGATGHGGSHVSWTSVSAAGLNPDVNIDWSLTP